MASCRKRVGGWRAEIAILGTRESKTFSTKAEAVAWASERETEIRRGADSGIVIGKSGGDAFDRYLEEVSIHKRGERWERLRLNAIGEVLIGGQAIKDSKLARVTPELLFEYRFKLDLILTDYAGDAYAIMVAQIARLKVHQLGLMANEETRKHGIAFEVAFNNYEKVNISIKLYLTERVAVKTGEASRLDIKHLAEIPHMPAYADEFWKLYDGDTLLPEWRTPEAQP